MKRIILARPAVEAGEKLGFLPGDLAEKVNPYLRPLYDALHDMMDTGRAAQLVEQGTVEVAPLAFMRGRTLNDAFVILDEAQNTTVEQMKMFLTRLGFHSKAVVTGDVTQVDLPQGKLSGLTHAPAHPRGRGGHRLLRLHRGGRGPPPAGAGGDPRLRPGRRGGEGGGSPGRAAGWTADLARSGARDRGQLERLTRARLGDCPEGTRRCGGRAKRLRIALASLPRARRFSRPRFHVQKRWAGTAGLSGRAALGNPCCGVRGNAPELGDRFCTWSEVPRAEAVGRSTHPGP